MSKAATTFQDEVNVEFRVVHAVQYAIRTGYRHIDTAFAYGNERDVGLGIKSSGVPREEIRLTTKLDNQWHQRIPEALKASLENLSTNYVDLYLMHWHVSLDPHDTKKIVEHWDYIDTWCEM
ncbi:Fc.00g106260.m01.CDS01 [Cosmosporella sp. VM-42]